MKYIVAAGIAFLAMAGGVRAQETVKPVEEDEGWRVVFDGKAHQGLRGLLHNDFLNHGWKIEEGILMCPKDFKHMGLVTGGDLITSEQFWDFEFSFEWRLSVSGKSGVLYFASGKPDKPTGFVYQIIDDTHHPDGLKGGPIRRTGSLLGIIPPAEDKKLNPPDQWNEGRVVVKGNHVEHWLNGGKVVEYTLGSPEFLKALAASGIKGGFGFGKKFRTAIVLIDGGEEIAFRNLKVRDLSAPGAPGATTAK